MKDGPLMALLAILYQSVEDAKISAGAPSSSATSGGTHLIASETTTSTDKQGTASMASLSLAILTAHILGSCCTTLDDQKRIIASGALPPLLTMLTSTHAKAQDAASHSIAKLTKDCKEACDQLQQCIIYHSSFSL